VLGGGVLATQSSSDPRLSTLVALAKEAACSVEELAIRFVLSTEGVQTAILGLSAVDHVRVAAAAVDQGPLDPELYSALEQVSLASFPS
jgi:aryl-alcohol dehydrogenase-like predicted oxidoreductase